MVSFEYIDDYFQGTQSPSKESDFEERLLTDKEFAEEVAFYLDTIQVAKANNTEIRKNRFKEIYRQNYPAQSAGGLRKLWPYAAMMAAAITALFVGIYFYMQPAQPSQMADDYLNTHLQTLGVQMNDTDDLLQQGKDLYNSKDYAGALKKFEMISQVNHSNSNYDAEENAGLAALQLRDYDKALVHFKNLTAIEGQNENSGKFYQGITLMKRNGKGDKELVVELFNDVVKNHLFGKDDAAIFLKHLN